MSTTLAILGIAAPVITFLIGRYFKSEKIEYLEKELGQTMAKVTNAHVDLLKAPKFQVVSNTQKHPAANDNYLYIEGEINGTREAGMLRLKQWEEAKETLSKNPEDKPQ